MDSTSTDGREHEQDRERELSHVVELVASPEPSDSVSEDQITPLLIQSDKPKINIFTVSYPRRKSNKDQIARLVETETSPVWQFVVWVWGGSRYSGLFCMVSSAVIYCVMEVLLDVCSAQSLPLFEVAFTRCVIISILSFMWLRRSGEPIFGPANVRNLLVSRALTGCVSLLAFIYCIQRLPMSQAMILSFTTPLMASVAARFILNENLKIVDVAGIAFSFFGVLFLLGSPTSIQGVAVEAKTKGVHVFAVLIGLVSALAGGVSYCYLRAAAKASDQPVGTIFSFGLLSTAAVAICMIISQDFVLPSFYSFVLMIFLSILAFFAELFLARGLQLEKTSKVANIQYLEVALYQLWGMGSLRYTLSFGKVVGCILVFVSACCTMYFGPEKEME
ncbi:putative EamA domain-containing protein [Helianthus annuus]|nr:putative EamA domain-containing protein [Helianthus annuus]